MLAAAETDLEPALSAPATERIGGIGAQLRQDMLQQPDLPGTQRMAARPTIQAVRRRLDRPRRPLRAQRPNALRSAGTRSVRSQLKVPRSSSGSRPKCPYADVGA